MQVTGRLENWEYDKVWKVIWGDVYGDVRERFPDGTRIHTSYIDLKNSNLIEGGVVTTLNSFYLLGRHSQGVAQSG